MGTSEDITIEARRRVLQTMSQPSSQMAGKAALTIDRLVHLCHGLLGEANDSDGVQTDYSKP